MIYAAHRLEGREHAGTDWTDALWEKAEVAAVGNFRPESAPAHRPRTAVKLMYSGAGLHGIFQVQDELVRCVRSGYFSQVWKDSCVEFFVEPVRNAGYFNFEFNCGGAFLCSHVTDPRRINGEIAGARKIPDEVAQQIQVFPSLPPRIDPEMTEPCDWTLGFFIPFSVFTPTLGGGERPRPGDLWRSNFYKCAEEVSHPHWAAWSPVRELNFHDPDCFGTLMF